VKILFFGAYFPRPNNATTGVWALSQLLALRDAGHEVKVVSPVPAIPAIVAKLVGRGSSATCPDHHSWDGIEAEYIRWPLYPVGPLAKVIRDRPDVSVTLAWILSFRKFVRIAEQFRPDVIYAHHGQLGGFIACRISRRLRVPFFITEHAYGDIESCATNPHRKQHYANIVQWVGRWIAVTKRMEQNMLEVFPSIPSTTIHNGGNPTPPAMKKRARPSALEGCLIVLSASFFYKRKRVPMLIKSFDAIADRHPTARLIVIGSGDDQAAVTQAANNAKHASQVILSGHLSHDEVLQYTAWCDIFINIAIQEPWATVLSDAMTAGKPIIFAADCGITDVAKDGEHGLCVKPDDGASASNAMDKLLGDDDLRRRLGVNAELLAKHELSWANNASRMTALFQSVVH
jgi:glycosyltransferase involved in cell wall biosynthesis